MSSTNADPSMDGESCQQQNVSMQTRTDTLQEFRDLAVSDSDSSDDDCWTIIDRLRFRDSDVICRGSSSIVFEGTFLGDQKVAIKRMQRVEVVVTMEDYKILSTSHPNVVERFQILRDLHFIYLVLELCQTNLEDMVAKRVINDSNIKVKLSHGIALGLSYLHDNNIIHGDLKPSNILIKVDHVTEEITPKIANFGLTRRFEAGKYDYTESHDGPGILAYSPPEASKLFRHSTEAIDIFAYGCIIHFINCPASKFHLRHPFGSLEHDIGSDDIIRAIRAGKRQIHLSTIMHRSNKNEVDVTRRIFCDILIQDLTNKDPENRPAMKHVLNFPLFWDADKQASFFSDIYNYINDDLEKFDDNCTMFFSHKKLRRLCTPPDNWNAIYELLKVAGLQSVPKAILSNGLYVNILRVLRNNITHYSVKGSNAGIPIDSMLTKFNQEFPYFFPVLWVTYRYLQIKRTYPEDLENIKCKLEAYYTPLDIADPRCLVENLEFIKE